MYFEYVCVEFQVKQEKQLVSPSDFDPKSLRHSYDNKSSLSEGLIFNIWNVSIQEN